VRFFFSSRRRHTRSKRDWSSDVCSSDLLHHAGRSGNYYTGVHVVLFGSRRPPPDRACFGWATTSRVSAWSHGPGQKLYPYRQKSHRDHYLVAAPSTKSRQLMLDRAFRLPANG